jgi:flagellar M-ring protein FliF
MQQLFELYARLSVRQRLWIVAAALAAGGALYGLTRWNHERGFAVLFAQLAPEDAGAVVARLRERNVEFRLREGGASVLVPAAQVDELRLDLAAGGLPRSGRLGFELFDKSSLGATEFAEQVNYRRAVEGELERTIRAIGDVEQARVHVSFPKESLFLEQQKPAKASVLLQLRPGRRLAPAAVQAIAHLTASAVEGLSPEAVSVVDTQGNLLSRPRRALAEAEGVSDAVLDYRKGVERDLAAKVQATLEPVLGAEHFRVGVSAEIDLTSGEQSEEVFDPARSVMVQSQRTEDGPAGAAAGGVPGTASNLPRAAPRSGGAASGGYVRRSEGITYQSSRTVKRTKVPQGLVRRLSLAVLVDHEARWEGSGAQARRRVTPPSAEKLKVIRDLAGAAVGLQSERGDQLVVESFPFAALDGGPPAQPVPPAPAPAARFGIPLPAWLGEDLRMLLLGGGAVAALALLAAAGWFRRRRRRRVRAEEAAKTLPGAPPGAHRSPEELEAAMQAQLAGQKQALAEKTAEQLAALQVPAAATTKADVLSKHIIGETRKDPQAMAQIVRSWLSAEES